MVAAEVRAELARRGISARKLAAKIGVSPMWVNRRVMMHADTDMTLEDLSRIADAMDVPVAKFLGDARILGVPFPFAA
jgi:transcriptional regulator with XRE-family HTH domain